MFAFALLLLALGGVVYMLGERDFAKRLIVFGIVAAVLGPVLGVLLSQVGAVLGPVIEFALMAGLVALVIGSWVRYAGRRRQLQQGNRQQPTSLKRRVDRDL
jgi:hypothetical protein